jgi:heme-degrading monooxygenase HmoA
MMIARIWRGAVAQADGDDYAHYMEQTGVAGYVSTPGNRGVWMLGRDVDDKTEFLMFTLWDSMQAVEAFAGSKPEVAVFYPEDDRFLVERETVVSHFQVETQAMPENAKR